MNPIQGPLHRHLVYPIAHLIPPGHVVVDEEDWKKARAILEALGPDWDTILNRFDALMHHVTRHAESARTREETLSLKFGPITDLDKDILRLSHGPQPVFLNQFEDVEVQMARAQNPTVCQHCGKPHLLSDEDAGSDREAAKLCLSCYKIHPPE